MPLDYSKWDRLGRQLDAEEKAEADREKARHRVKYEKEQLEKQTDYIEKHGHEPPKSTCCGFAGPEQIKEMRSDHKHGKEELSLEDRNEKKRKAVFATWEDGNRLFKEEKYQLAFDVYERGVLIINGIYGMDSKEHDEMLDLEKTLSLNMSAALLKLKEYGKAIEQCQIVLQSDPSCAKAHYRSGKAFLEMGEPEKAMEHLEKAKILDPEDSNIKKLARKVYSELIRANSKHKASLKQFASAFKSIS